MTTQPKHQPPSDRAESKQWPPSDEPPIYRQGNPFQRRMYEHLGRYNAARGQRVFGVSPNGTPYAHLLPESDALRNFLDDERILATVERRFASHKAGDRGRALTNSAASQAFCFNLFVPLAEDLPVASTVIGALMGRAVTVEHIEIEFTPNTLAGLQGFELRVDESLGDQTAKAGTDADVAIFFSDAGGRSVLLIETKLIEPGFSVCASFENKEHCKVACGRSDFLARVVEERAVDSRGHVLCGYLNYENWSLTKAWRAMELGEIRASNGCPFRFSGQQLWRNMLLAEKACRARKLDDFAFWVISPRDNKELWRDKRGDVQAEFRRVLTPFGNKRFRSVTMEDVLEALRGAVTRTPLSGWLEAFEEKYVLRPVFK